MIYDGVYTICIYVCIWFLDTKYIYIYWNIQRGVVYVSVQQPRPFLFPIFRFCHQMTSANIFPTGGFSYLSHTPRQTVLELLYCNAEALYIILCFALYPLEQCKSAGRRLDKLFTWFCVSSAFRSCPCRRRPR
jgi:hypothetical protein